MPIIIAGASVRAAAHSAFRAGFDVIAFDLFADQDLQKCARTTPIRNGYPRAIAALINDYPPDIPWMYTGGIENHADLIAEISQDRALLGNNAETVRKCRDPAWLAELAKRAGWYFPSLDAPVDQSRFLKPVNHCGGMGAKRLAPGEQNPYRDSHDVFEFIEGQTFGGVAIVTDEFAQLVGVTAQFQPVSIEQHPLRGSHPYAYTGSIGPNVIRTEDEETWRHLVTQLRQTGLVGVIGIDAILGDQAGWTLLEINPRWTASVELFEMTCDWNAFQSHLAACQGSVSKPFSKPSGSAAKQVVWASEPTRVTDEWLTRVTEALQKFNVQLRDIPGIGTEIEPGHPMFTAIASGECFVEVEDRLRTAIVRALDGAD